MQRVRFLSPSSSLEQLFLLDPWSAIQARPRYHLSARHDGLCHQDNIQGVLGYSQSESQPLYSGTQDIHHVSCHLYTKASSLSCYIYKHINYLHTERYCFSHKENLQWKLSSLAPCLLFPMCFALRFSRQLCETYAFSLQVVKQDQIHLWTCYFFHKTLVSTE